MKLISILGTQVSRYISLNYPIGGIYIPEIINQIRNRYSFVIAPTSVQEWNPIAGVLFSQGIFASSKEEKIIIDKLQIYNNGITVSTLSYAENVDLFIDDLIDFMVKELNFVSYPQQIIKKLYVSQVEIELNIEFAKLFVPAIDNICNKVNSTISKYSKDIEFEATAIHLKPKNSTQAIAPFTLEKREGLPSNSNIYYSVSPFATKDHLEALKSLE